MFQALADELSAATWQRVEGHVREGALTRMSRMKVGASGASIGTWEGSSAARCGTFGVFKKDGRL